MSVAGPDTDGPATAVPVDTVRRLLASVSAGVESDTEARWIVAAAAGLSPGTLVTALGHPVSADTVAVAREMARRRLAGEPLQYVLGTWSFRSLEVKVDGRVLVPRPETEQVVEVALGELRRLDGPEPVVAVDLGTGSGVIALSLALEGAGGPGGLEVWGTDASTDALELAAANGAELARWRPGAAARVRWAEGSWFDALPRRLAGRVGLVVSNPPYVSADEWSALDPVIRDHEPRTALVPGETGLEALALLIDEARAWLGPGGSLVVELAPHQAGAMARRAEETGYVDVGVRPDLSGRDRILVARWPGG